MKRRVVAHQRTWAGEKLLTLKELSRELLRNPDSPVKRSHWSLRKWAVEGVEVNGNGTVKLPTTKILGARYSSVQAVVEFWVMLAEHSEG